MLGTVDRVFGIFSSLGMPSPAGRMHIPLVLTGDLQSLSITTAWWTARYCWWFSVTIHAPMQRSGRSSVSTRIGPWFYCFPCLESCSSQMFAGFSKASVRNYLLSLWCGTQWRWLATKKACIWLATLACEFSQCWWALCPTPHSHSRRTWICLQST